MVFKKRKSRSGSRDYTLHNKVHLVRGGKQYFDTLVRMIDDAQTSIHFHTYIFDNDHTGNLVADALKRAAARGVRVKMLLDGYASQKLRGEFVEGLLEAGIAFRWFEPILRSRYFYFGRRLHHKVVVTDNTFSLVGGVNISDKYNDVGEEPAWLDWAVFTEGEASAELAKACIHLWQRSNKYFRGRTIEPDVEPCRIPQQTCKVRVRRNDWVSARNEITRSYFELMRNAKSHIIFMSSYFMPSPIFRGFIRKARRRGVKVSIIVSGKSDVLIAKAAERYLYSWLFRNGVEIYEYNDSVLHGKLSTSDGRFTTIGSYNINNISAYASVELNLDIENEKFAQDVESAFQEIMDQCCTLVKQDEYKIIRNPFFQVGRWMAYNFVRVMFFVFTFYFRQHRE